MPVKIKILGVAEGREHAAQVCGDVLQDKDDGHAVLLAGAVQDIIAQRQEGQKRHIVGDEHGAQKGDIDQCDNSPAQIAEALHHLAGQQVEELDVFQGADHCQHTEQAGQRPEIKIAQIFPVRRHKAGRGRSRQQRHAHHRILFYKALDPAHICSPFQKALQYGSIAAAAENVNENALDRQKDRRYNIVT